MSPETQRLQQVTANILADILAVEPTIEGGPASLQRMNCPDCVAALCDRHRIEAQRNAYRHAFKRVMLRVDGLLTLVKDAAEWTPLTSDEPLPAPVRVYRLDEDDPGPEGPEKG